MAGARLEDASPVCVHSTIGLRPKSASTPILRHPERLVCVSRPLNFARSFRPSSLVMRTRKLNRASTQCACHRPSVSSSTSVQDVSRRPRTCLLASGPFSILSVHGILVVGEDSGIAVFHRSITGRQIRIIQLHFYFLRVNAPQSTA